jgi:hypothetical protein
MYQRKRMSLDHHPQLRDVTADTENTASSIVACWTVFIRVVAWQRVDQIRYNILVNQIGLKVNSIFNFLFLSHI